MSDTNGSQTVTRAELRAELHSLEDRVIRAIGKSQAEIVERMQEFVRDSQTELLRGFQAFATSQTVQIRKLKADLSNVDTATDQRLSALEQRLLEIEKRLQIPPPTL
jgi:hypothetical protein